MENTQKKQDYNPEEEVVADGNWKIIDLPEVDLGSGEEAEENLFECTVKLYRYDDKQWKERAVGQFKFLKHKQNNRARGILRQVTTKKIFANFFSKASIFWLVFQCWFLLVKRWRRCLGAF